MLFSVFVRLPMLLSFIIAQLIFQTFVVYATIDSMSNDTTKQIDHLHEPSLTAETQIRQRKNCSHLFTKFMQEGVVPRFQCDQCKRPMQGDEVFYGCDKCNIDLCMEFMPHISCSVSQCKGKLKILENEECPECIKGTTPCRVCHSRFSLLQCDQNGIKGHPNFTICTRYVFFVVFVYVCV